MVNTKRKDGVHMHDELVFSSANFGWMDINSVEEYKDGIAFLRAVLDQEQGKGRAAEPPEIYEGEKAEWRFTVRGPGEADVSLVAGRNNVFPRQPIVSLEMRRKGKMEKQFRSWEELLWEITGRLTTPGRRPALQFLVHVSDVAESEPRLTFEAKSQYW
jgi:hypothetical protein